MTSVLQTRRAPSAHTGAHTSPYAGAYTPPAAEAAVAEALGCIIAGRPLPERLRAPRYEPSCPATVAAGIARILASPRAARA